MALIVMHCRKCGAKLTSKSPLLRDKMMVIRDHYKSEHPKQFAKSIVEGVKKRRAARKSLRKARKARRS